MFFRKNIEKMKGYIPGEQPSKKNITKLNTNENPYPPSPNIKKCLDNLKLTSLRNYPNPTADKLRKAIAKNYSFKLDNIIIGNGSDDILAIIINSFVPENGNIIYFNPSYSLYETLTQIQGAHSIKLDLDNNFNFPNSTKLPKNAQLLFIPRPNSPTGNNCNKQWLAKIIQSFNGIVVIDEAYADFADDNCLEFIKKFNNVIITRTFSKSYALAGLRIGFAIASENLIKGMMKVRDSYNVNFISQIAALEAIKDQKYFVKCINKIKKNREKLKQELQILDFKIIPSQTNFLFVKPPQQIKAINLFNKLRYKKIYTRYFTNEITKNFIRITIGTSQQNTLLIKTIKKILKCV